MWLIIAVPVVRGSWWVQIIATLHEGYVHVREQHIVTWPVERGGLLLEDAPRLHLLKTVERLYQSFDGVEHVSERPRIRHREHLARR